MRPLALAWTALALASLPALDEEAARAAPVIEPSAGLGVELSYDSNAFNGRGPELVTRLSPHLALRLRDERTAATLVYDMGAWFYARGTARNTLNHRAAFGLESQVTRRLHLRLADEFIQAEDPGFLVRAGVVAPQTSITDNTVDAALAYRATRRLTLEVLGSYRRTTFGAAPAGEPPLHDGDQVDAGVALAVAADRRDDLRLSHRFQYFTADGAGLAVANATLLGWRRQLLPALELRLEAGPLVYTVLGGQPVVAAGASGVTWKGAGVLRFATPRWRAALSVVRDLVGGTGAASVLWAEYVNLSVGVRPLRQLDLRVDGGVFANGFAPDQRWLYDGAYAMAILDVALVDGLHLGGYYSFRWQEDRGGLDPAAAPLPSITRHIVGLRLVGVLGAEARPPRRPRGAP